MNIDTSCVITTNVIHSLITQNYVIVYEFVIIVGIGDFYFVEKRNINLFFGNLRIPRGIL